MGRLCSKIPEETDNIIPIGDDVSLALAIWLDVASFMVLYMLLPHGAATWREILPGAPAAVM
jgi:uncharacterized BrkB/YihY/UPF0761 family membrane protein